MRKILLITFFVLVMGTISAQEIAGKGVVRVKVDKILVLHAVDGYLVGPGNDTKYFIFGSVKFHKPGAPEDQWSGPGFYLEIDGVGRTFSARFHHYLENYTPVALRELQGWTRDLELDMVFTRDGELVPWNSTVAFRPPGVRGRNITSLEVVGFYKKGSRTELFVPIRNKEGKIINLEERGDPIYKNRSVMVAQVCYEYSPGVGNLYRPTGLCRVYRVQSISRSVSNIVVEVPYTPVPEVEVKPKPKVETPETEAQQPRLANESLPPPALPEHLKPPSKPGEPLEEETTTSSPVETSPRPAKCPCPPVEREK